MTPVPRCHNSLIRIQEKCGHPTSYKYCYFRLNTTKPGRPYFLALTRAQDVLMSVCLALTCLESAAVTLYSQLSLNVTGGNFNTLSDLFPFYSVPIIIKFSTSFNLC